MHAQARLRIAAANTRSGPPGGVRRRSGARPSVASSSSSSPAKLTLLPRCRQQDTQDPRKTPAPPPPLPPMTTTRRNLLTTAPPAAAAALLTLTGFTPFASLIVATNANAAEPPPADSTNANPDQTKAADANNPNEQSPPPRTPPRDLGKGVRGVDLIPGNEGGLIAQRGSTVRVLLKGRLFAKQGWVFTNDYVEVDGEVDGNVMDGGLSAFPSTPCVSDILPKSSSD